MGLSAEKKKSLKALYETWGLEKVRKFHRVPVNALEETVHELAASIAENAPLTIRASKTIVTEAMKSPEDRDLALCHEQVEACMNSDDYAEGRTAFMEKRKPKFTGK